MPASDNTFRNTDIYGGLGIVIKTASFLLGGCFGASKNNLDKGYYFGYPMTV